jgi:hypothetical protein
VPDDFEAGDAEELARRFPHRRALIEAMTR